MKYRYFYIQLVILIVFNILLFNFPLTNILGYEYSVLNSILITMLSGFLAITLLKQFAGRNKSDYKLLLKHLVEGNAVFIIVALLMGLAAALFIKNCSIIAGIVYFGIITIPAVIIGTALGVLSYYISSRFPKLLFLLVYIFILALPLYELYFYPQIYFYNPILGYLPGTIYDEAVKIDLKLISYRLLNVIFFSAILVYLLNQIINGRKRKVLFIAAVMSTGVLFFFFSHYFGFSTPYSRMKSELREFVSTEHFDIYFDESINENTKRLIILHHEYYFEEISKRLNVYRYERIKSFIFKDASQKKKLLGTANADMAKPWLNTIFVVYDNYDQTLKHEIVHALSAEFGATIFKLGGYLNPALTEGIASAVDDEYDRNTIHFMAALASRSGYKINIPNLFSGLSFFGQVSGLSYIYAGSFSKFLMDAYGVEKYKAVYSGEEFEEVYSKKLEELSVDYYKFLNAYNGNFTKAMGDYYFGRLTIFKKVCARYLAEQLNVAWRTFYEGKFTAAKDQFRKLYQLTDSYPAFSGYVNSLIKADEDKKAFDLILENQHKYINTAYYFNIDIILADIAVKLKKFEAADSIYHSIIEQYPSKNLVYISSLRKELLKDTTKLRKYISGTDKEKYIILKEMNTEHPDYITISVLITLTEENEKDKNFLLQLADNIMVNDSISRYSAFMLSEYAVSLGEFITAKKLSEKALEYKYGDQRIVLEDHLRKINWLIKNTDHLNPERKI